MSKEHLACTTSKDVNTYHDLYSLLCRFSEKLFDSSLFSCRFIVGGESLEGQLVNSRGPEIVTYLHVSFRRSGVNHLFACSALVLHEQTGCLAKLDDHLQATGH